MKKSLMISALLALTGTASAQLVITEVYEANGANLKYLEIHNTTNSAIDLGAGGWKITRYTNASSTGTDIGLTGSVAARDYYVIANNATDFNTNTFGFDADQYNGNITHTGDDEYELRDSMDTVIDAFAADHIGNTTDFSDETVAFRLLSAYPNNGDWGDSVKPADNATSASGFWRVRHITASNANATTVATPGAKGGAGGDELPVELQSFSVE